jgi:hypothetical protein
MEVADFLKETREKTIKKWEDAGLLEGLEGHTKTDTTLFESNPSQIVTEPQLNIHPEILRDMRQAAAIRPSYSYAPNPNDSDAPVEDPAQLKLFDIDNPPVAELSTPVTDVPVIEVPPVVEEVPAPQDRIIVFEDEKKN